jgi:molybdate transport system permease protein
MGGFLSPAEATALLLSLQVSGTAVAVALPFAFLTALVLARYRFAGAGLIDAVVHLPLVLPPVAVGYLLLVVFGGRGPIGAWLWETFSIRFVFSWTGAVLASALITFPLQVRAIRLALEGTDAGLSAAARTLGAGWWDRLANVTVPLALPGIVSGAITAFAASLGEFGAIITFVSNIPGETQTLPLAIYAALQSPGGTVAAARLCALSIGLALVFVTAGNLAARSLRR